MIDTYLIFLTFWFVGSASYIVINLACPFAIKRRLIRDATRMEALTAIYKFIFDTRGKMKTEREVLYGKNDLRLRGELLDETCD